MTRLSQIITDQHYYTYVSIKALKSLELERKDTASNANMKHSSISSDFITEMVNSRINPNQRGTTNN